MKGFNTQKILLPTYTLVLLLVLVKSIHLNYWRKVCTKSLPYHSICNLVGGVHSLTESRGLAQMDLRSIALQAPKPVDADILSRLNIQVDQGVTPRSTWRVRLHLYMGPHINTHRNFAIYLQICSMGRSGPQEQNIHTTIMICMVSRN